MSRFQDDSDDWLVAQFARAAEQHGRATERGDAIAANSAYADMIAVVDELRARTRVRRLLELLDRASLPVRVWAASMCLQIEPSRAQAVLEEVAAGPPSPYRLDAEMTLRQYGASSPPTGE
jgi:hypothetical protein